MGYKNNQFFTSPTGGGGYEDIGKGTVTNPPFDEKDLRNKVRYIEREIDPRTGQIGPWGLQTTTLKRGYIRSLLEHVQGAESAPISVPLVKCNFQFNPQYIQHSVPMRSGLTNLFLQDAAQFSQPVSGDVTFGFELFFDRTYLLNNEDKGAGGRGSASEKNIGVLADLRSLYEVIGQGVSESMLEAQRERAIQQAQTEAFIENADVIGSAATAGTTVSTYSLKDSQTISQNAGLASIFNKDSNSGNVSFLIPMPVRVVFSSLFMVDGYVTQTDVTYTKFSSTLVPIQCTVALSMQAMYLGFAKEKTFLTTNLEAADEAIKKQQADTIANANEVNLAVAPSIGKFTVKPITDMVVTNLVSNTSTSGTLESVEQLLMPTDKLITLFYGTSGSPPAGVTTTSTTNMKIDIQGDEGDKIRKLFDEQNALSINMDIKLRTYGPYSAGEAATVKTMLEKYVPSGLSGPIGTAGITGTPLPPDNQFISEMVLKATSVPTGDSWDSIRSGTKVESKIEFKAGKPTGYTRENLGALAAQGKRFVTACNATVTVNTSGVPRPIAFKPSVYTTPLMGVTTAAAAGYTPTFSKIEEKKLSFDMNKA